jgi:hypothetical protein
MWNGQILKLSYTHIHSFAADANITIKGAMSLQSIQELFHLPLSEEPINNFVNYISLCNPYNRMETKILGPISRRIAAIHQQGHINIYWENKKYIQLFAGYGTPHAKKKYKVFFWLLLQGDCLEGKICN